MIHFGREEWSLFRQGGTPDDIVRRLVSDLPHDPKAFASNAAARNYDLVSHPAWLVDFMKRDDVSPERKGIALSMYYNTGGISQELL